MRIVMIALLAAVVLTLAYPMSARKTANPGNAAAPAAGAAARADVKLAQETDPQLSFSMRTVVRPAADAQRVSDRKAPAGHPADSAPKFEGYVTPPAAR